MMNRVRTVVLLALFAATLATGLALASPERAGAYTTSFQANILGGHNNTYGNYGETYSVDALWGEIVGHWIYSGHTLPISVAIQEACRDNDVTSDQWDVLTTYLRTYGYYARQFYEAKGGGDECEDKGNGILGRMNDNNAQWYSPFHGAFPNGDQDLNEDETRGRACVYPTLWIVQYATCSAHMTNGSAAKADAQANRYFTDMGTQVLSGKASIFPGDFNREPQHASNPTRGPQTFYQSGWAIETSGWYLFPTTNANTGLVKKVDYAWIWGFTNQAPPNVLVLPQVPELGNLRASDHAIIVSFT